MCKKLVYWIINNPKFLWLKKNNPNPYNFFFDKLDFSLWGTALISLILVGMLAKEIPCISIIMILFGFSTIFLGIRGIISNQVDLELPTAKTGFCFVLLIILISTLQFVINGIECVINY